VINGVAFIYVLRVDSRFKNGPKLRWGPLATGTAQRPTDSRGQAASSFFFSLKFPYLRAPGDLILLDFHKPAPVPRRTLDKPGFIRQNSSARSSQNRSRPRIKSGRDWPYKSATRTLARYGVPGDAASSAALEELHRGGISPGTNHPGTLGHGRSRRNLHPFRRPRSSSRLYSEEDLWIKHVILTSYAPG